MKLLRRAVGFVADTLDVHVFRKSSGAAWPEAHFSKRLFERLEPDCVFDVGANSGQYATSLRMIDGYTGTILSFEPNPSAFDKLSATAATDPNWHCFPYALGSESGTQDLFVPELDVFASLRRPSDHATEHFPKETRIAGTKKIEVRTLESIMDGLKRTHNFRRPFLKMDTQGFDLEVLAGTGDQSFCGLLSEVALTPLYDGAPTIEQSLAEFRRRGFTVVGLFDVQASNRFTQVLECNCYCVRSDLADAF